MDGTKEPETPSPRILVVDDNATTRTMLAGNLKRWGYEPILVPDGEDAWERITTEADPPRLMLLDWEMPNVSGIELCRRVRAMPSFRPVYLILVTGRDTTADLVEGLDAGADDFLRKPFDPAELRSRIGVGMRMLTYQRSLAEREKQYRDLVESGHSVILTLAPDQTVTFSNPFAHRTLGRTGEELTGTNFPDLFHGDYNTDPLGSIPQTHTDTEPLYNAEIPCCRGNGSLVWIAWSFKALREDTGKLEGILAIGNDVTDRRQAESALVRQERVAAMGLLAAGVAHQFNNIHTSVLGNAELLGMDETLSKHSRDIVETIVASLRRATVITKRLFQITHAQNAERVHLPLQSLVEGLVCCVKPELDDLGIALKEGTEETPPLHMDRAGLSQALLCLLQNARDALIETVEPCITIRTGVKDQDAFVSISDNGCGIAREDLDQVMLPFFSRKGEHAIGRTPLTRVRGVGLGLSLCDAVVREHHGRIEVESIPGQGSCFTILLPLHPLPV